MLYGALTQHLKEDERAKFDFLLNDPPAHLKTAAPSQVQLESDAAAWRAAAAGAAGGRIGG